MDARISVVPFRSKFSCYPGRPGTVICPTCDYDVVGEFGAASGKSDSIVLSDRYSIDLWHDRKRGKCDTDTTLLKEIRS